MKNHTLSSIRNEYSKGSLSKKDLKSDPIHQLEIWIGHAIQSKVEEPTAMVLSTIGEDNFPQSRIVLLKSANINGLTFFSNYNSEKGKAIERESHVSLLFFWPTLQRQVRITGIVSKLVEKESDDYFYSRPIESQIAAIISNQSEIISSREKLEEKFNSFQRTNQPIIRPEWWGGYLVNPMKIEFWQGGKNRIHDRFVYIKKESNWEILRLEP